MTRAKLIKEHGRLWNIYVVEYAGPAEPPCVDCGHETITRAVGNLEEPLCGDCAAWRLGRMEGLREAREQIKAETRRHAEDTQLAALAALSPGEAKR